MRFRSAIATGINVIRAQYLADGRSRLVSVLSPQSKRSNGVILVGVKSSSGGGRCRGFFGWVVSCFGGSQVCVLKVRDVDSELDRLREPLVLSMSHSLPLLLMLSFLRLCRVSFVLAARVLDLLV